METLPYVFLAVGVSFLAIVAAIRFTLLHHETRNKIAFLLLLGSVIWLLMSALEIASDSLPTKLVIYKMYFVGVLIVPTTWLILTMQLSGYGRWIKRSNLVVLSAVPVISLLLIFTNESHGLMWSNITLNSVDPFLPLNANRGLGYWLLIVAYSYVALMFAVVIFVRRVVASRSLYRRQPVLLILVSCIPWALNAIWFVNPTLFMYINPAPLGLTVATSITLWRMAYLPGADIIPVAHEMIVDSMNEAVIILNAQTQIVELNPSAQQLVGHNLSDALGKPVERIWAEWASVKKELDSRTEKVREVSFGVGEEKKVYEMQNAYLSGITSERPNLLIILRDITERKRVEQELENSLSVMRATLESTADGILVVGQDEKITDYNQKWVEFFNVTQSILASHDDQELMKFITSKTKDPEGFERKTRELIANPNLEGLDLFELEDGRVFERYSRPQRMEGKTVGRVISFRDVTERKQMEEELRRYSENLKELVEGRTHELKKSEEKYRLLVDNMAAVVFTIDIRGNFTFTNRAAEEVTGYSMSRLLSMNMKELIAPEFFSQIQERLQKRVKGEGELPSVEFEITRANGKRFPVEMMTTPILNEENALIGILGVVRGITERKRMEKALLEAERLATIGETAAMVGHDLRNPLQGITSAAYVLKTKLRTSMDETIRSMLEIIDSDIKYSDKIVSDLLDYAREIYPELAETNLNSLIEDALASVHVPENIHVKLPEKEARINVDPEKMKRVFVNMIRNAVEAMPEGGTLNISTKKSDGKMEITFTDTGKGIPQEVMEKLWKPLQTTKARGMGMGLAICKRMVQAHGGVITAESAPGKGSTFTITLPIESRG